MLAHETFAQVFEGKVKNLMVCKDYPTADYITKSTYGSEAQAIDCQYIPVQEGDKYRDNCFWRPDPETGEEVQIEPVPTEAQQITELKAENEELILALAEMMGGGES